MPPFSQFGNNQQWNNGFGNNWFSNNQSWNNRFGQQQMNNQAGYPNNMRGMPYNNNMQQGNMQQQQRGMPYYNNNMQQGNTQQQQRGMPYYNNNLQQGNTQQQQRGMPYYNNNLQQGNMQQQQRGMPNYSNNMQQGNMQQQQRGMPNYSNNMQQGNMQQQQRGMPNYSNNMQQGNMQQQQQRGLPYNNMQLPQQTVPYNNSMQQGNIQLPQQTAPYSNSLPQQGNIQQPQQIIPYNNDTRQGNTQHHWEEPFNGDVQQGGMAPQPSFEELLKANPEVSVRPVNQNNMAGLFNNNSVQNPNIPQNQTIQDNQDNHDNHEIEHIPLSYPLQDSLTQQVGREFIKGKLENFMQSEKNASEYYKYLSDISVNDEYKKFFAKLSRDNEAQNSKYHEIYSSYSEIPFYVKDSPLPNNARQGFKDCVINAIREECKNIKDLSDINIYNNGSEYLKQYFDSALYKKTSDINMMMTMLLK